MKFIAEMMYLVAALLFVTGLKRLNKPATARNGNLISSVGMLLAVIATLIEFKVVDYSYIIVGLLIGSIIGAVLARIVKMTEMPQMVALLNGFGGLASFLVGWSEYYKQYQMALDPLFPYSIELYTSITLVLTILVGGVTFSGSVIAWAKLKEVMTGKPILFKGQQFVNGAILLAAIVSGILFILAPANGLSLLIFLSVIALLLGVTSVIPIGGADMPVVISLLNSYSGIAGSLAGFVIQNNVLIVTGALVGASGLILTNIMCKAMNRSLANVLFSGFGAVTSGGGEKAQGKVKPINVEDAYLLLEAARSVVIVPG
ncbi:MAG: NAD(P)(+) transhydrogenase (Re/Si-specific) subunit beta, partial [Bacteroidetes bacterium]|nr:NAD(P)(+) transhydrogenase (Re/Si-specific) subunit beta [Bacteroidota bacterium]